MLSPFFFLHIFQDYQTDSRTTVPNLVGSPFDMKKPPGLGSLIASSGDPANPHGVPGGHPGHAFSHYSQMGMHVKSHMMGGPAGGVTGGMPGGIPGGGVPGGGVGVTGGARAPTMTDWFGKMMSFSSSCQPPVLPSYYQNSMYSTEKIDSHL